MRWPRRAAAQLTGSHIRVAIIVLTGRPDGPLLEASGSRARLPRSSPRRRRTAGSHGAVQPHCSGILSLSPTRPWRRSLQHRGSPYRIAVCRPEQVAFTVRCCFPYAANAAAMGRVPVGAGGGWLLATRCTQIVPRNFDRGRGNMVMWKFLSFITCITFFYFISKETNLKILTGSGFHALWS